MNEIIKMEQLARKFLGKTVGVISANPSFFVYYMTKTDREEMIYQLESLDLKSKEAHELVDEYLIALRKLEDKIGRFSVFCEFDDSDYDEGGWDYRSFVSRASANRAYFEPIDNLSEETLDEIFKQNLTLEELTKKYNLDPKTFVAEYVSVDSCLED